MKDFDVFVGVPGTDLELVRIVTVAEAADRLGVSDRRVRQLVAMDCPACSGAGCSDCMQTGFRLPNVRFGGRVTMVLESGLDLDWNKGRSSGRGSEYAQANREAAGS